MNYVTFDVHVYYMTTRRGPGQEYIRITLGDIIEDLADYNKPLEIDSLKVRVCNEYLKLFLEKGHLYLWTRCYSVSQ